MKILKNKVFASVVAAALAVFAVFGMGGSKLDDAHWDALSLFYGGSSEFSIYEDMTDMREVSFNLLHIAESAGSAIAETDYRAGKICWENFDQHFYPDAELEPYYAALVEGMGDLYDAIMASDIKQADKDRADSQYIRFKALASNVAFDDAYRTAAEGFNAKPHDPLTLLVAKVNDIERLPLF